MKKKWMLKDEKGVALLMILTSITLLTYIMSEFTFETKLNKFRIYNQQDKTQARLNAESGLTLAMAQLKVYKEARNTIDKNKSLKGSISPNALEGMVTRPFKIPIPLSKGASGLQKSAMADFEKNLLVQGELFVQCNPVTGFLNPNALRTKKEVKKPASYYTRSSRDNRNDFQDDRDDFQNDRDDFQDDRDDDEDEEDDKGKSIAEIIEKDLTQSLVNVLESEREKNEDFEEEFGDLEAHRLIKELKYFVRAKGDMPETEKAEVDSNYMNLNAKHSPLSSLHELYLLQGWPDAVIDLFKDRLSVHQVSVINLNKITNKQLKALFPEITEEQLKEFFKYRDGSEEDKAEPHPFNKESDFKDYLTKTLNVIDESSYEAKKKELKKAKMSLGVAGNLFRCISEGKYGRATYKLETFVNMPIREPTESEIRTYYQRLKRWKKSGKKGKKPEPTWGTDILDPRVVEINII